MPPFDAFLSYNGLERPLIEQIAQGLQQQGLDVFFDRWYLTPGAPWVEQLEGTLGQSRAVAVFIGPTGMGRWQQREQSLALDVQARQPGFRVIPVLLPGGDPPLGFLSLNTWVDLRPVTAADAATVLAAAIRGATSPATRATSAAARAAVCPYRGLRTFREEDGPFLFGRDAFASRLQALLTSRTMIAAVGASGIGKSSVVRAGLLPRLRADRRAPWEILTLVPTDRPLHSLAAAAISLLEPDLTEVDRLTRTSQLAVEFAAGRVLLRDVVTRILERQPGTARLLLVADQWEELYTLTTDDGPRQQFINQVLDATAAVPLSVVLTVRGDFYDRIADHRDLSDRLQDAQVNISRMNRGELRDAIEKPAAATGLRFEPGLVDRLLEASVDEPGSLPLLEFVLTELWHRRDGDQLTHAAYEHMGQLRGAIAAHAESTFAGLTQDDQDRARRIFLQLVRPGQDQAGAPSDPTRRRTSFDDIGPAHVPVARVLANAHLIVTGRDDGTGDEVIDLVHEALINAWQRLQQWVEDERQFLLWREQLRALMALSSSARSGGAPFLPAGVIPEARGYLRTHEAILSTTERAYLRSAIAAHRRNQAMKVGAGIVALILLAVLAYSWRGPRGDAPAPGPAPPAPAGVLTVRTVVHVVYRTDDENISDDQVRSQIRVLNEDFSATNPDLALVPAPFKEAVGNAQLAFALATEDPFGDPTTGITRTKTSLAAFLSDDAVKHTHRGGIDAWPGYLNIWVCTLGQSMLEYAQFPGGAARTEGPVVSNRGFGTTGTATAPFNRGRSATHSIGHWLNLRHIWGDGGCTATDGIDDTPPQAGPTFGAPKFPKISCGNGPNGDMFMNFMDYTDDAAMHMFTKGQVVAMRKELLEPRKRATILPPR